MSAFRSLPRKFPGVEVIKVTRASRVGQASAVLLVNTGTKHSPDHWGRLRVLDGYPKENGRSSETLLITSIPSHTTEKPSQPHGMLATREKTKHQKTQTHFTFL